MSKDTDAYLAAMDAREAGDVRALVGLLSPPGSPGFAIWVLNALGEAGDPSIAPEMLAYLELDQRPGPTGAALRALGRLRYPQAIPALVRAAKSGEPYRLYAIDALGSIGGPPAIDALSEAAAAEEPLRRLTVAEALGTIGGDEVVPTLSVLLRDSNWRVRNSAYGALRSIETRAAVDALESAIEDTKGPLVRRGMRRRVRRIRDRIAERGRSS
jgi:HEAT repeat protein